MAFLAALLLLLGVGFGSLPQAGRMAHTGVASHLRPLDNGGGLPIDGGTGAN